jgi:hypothetical protein
MLVLGRVPATHTHPLDIHRFGEQLRIRVDNRVPVAGVSE